MRRMFLLLPACTLIWCSIVCCRPLLAHSGPAADTVVGTWIVAEKDATIQIYRQDGAYFGRITWLREEAGPNAGAPVGSSDSRMHEEPRVGMLILRNFRFNGQDWEGGTLYDPTDGKTYKGTLTMDDKGMLHVRGFIGFRLLGRTTVWQRAR